MLIDENEYLRLVECWLPLAETINMEQGWGYDAAALEELIIFAAPALQLIHRVEDACTTLGYHHLLLERTQIGRAHV